MNGKKNAGCPIEDSEECVEERIKTFGLPSTRFRQILPREVWNESRLTETREGEERMRFYIQDQYLNTSIEPTVLHCNQRL